MCKLSAAAQQLDGSDLANYALIMKLADITPMSKQCLNINKEEFMSQLG